MGETANIGLHQWAGTDPFLREDFNEDFRKIDMAVGGLLCSEVAVPLLRATIAQNVSAVEFDLGGLDLAQYQELRIKTKNFSTVQTSTILAVLNSDRTDGHYISSSTGGLSALGKQIVLARATYQGRPGSWEAVLYLSHNGVFIESRGLTTNHYDFCSRERCFGCTAPTSAVTGENLTMLTLEASAYDFASGEIYIFGVKR